jgi:hypothetical protein
MELIKIWILLHQIEDLNEEINEWHIQSLLAAYFQI